MFPPNTIIRSLFESNVATCPYLPCGAVPVGDSAMKVSFRVLEIIPSQTSFSPVLVEVCKPPKMIICWLTGSNTAECDRRPAGPRWVQLGLPPDAVTVRIADPEIAPSEAVMVEVPASNPVARPWLPDELLIDATASVAELHVTAVVMFWLLPSVYVPVAVNCCVALTAIIGDGGVIEMDVSAAELTVRLALPVTPP